jgi:hypothetical protein
VNRDLRARLLHDVGKYVARTARNLPESPSLELVDMLARDLYALRPGRRASQLLDEISAGLEHPLIRAARVLLGEADRLESRVRRADHRAVARVAAIAREVEQLLLELCRDAA